MMLENATQGYGFTVYSLLFKAAADYLSTLFLSNTDSTDLTDICRGGLSFFYTDSCSNRSWYTDYLDNTDICRGNLWLLRFAQ